MSAFSRTRTCHGSPPFAGLGGKADLSKLPNNRYFAAHDGGEIFARLEAVDLLAVEPNAKNAARGVLDRGFARPLQRHQAHQGPAAGLGRPELDPERAGIVRGAIEQRLLVRNVGPD